MSYFKNLPRVYMLNIETGIQEVVGDFPGMTLLQDFHLTEVKLLCLLPKM